MVLTLGGGSGGRGVSGSGGSNPVYCFGRRTKILMSAQTPEQVPSTRLADACDPSRAAQELAWICSNGSGRFSGCQTWEGIFLSRRITRLSPQTRTVGKAFVPFKSTKMVCTLSLTRLQNVSKRLIRKLRHNNLHKGLEWFGL